MKYSTEGFRISSRREVPDHPGKKKYDLWAKSEISGEKVTDGIKRLYAAFLAAEDGLTDPDSIYITNNRIISTKASQAIPPKAPERWRNGLGYYRHLSVHGFTVYMEESWVDIFAKSKYAAPRDYTAYAKSTGLRETIKTFFLSEGDDQGSLFRNGKPAITIWRANFDRDNVQHLARMIVENFGATVVIIPRPLENYSKGLNI